MNNKQHAHPLRFYQHGLHLPPRAALNARYRLSSVHHAPWVGSFRVDARGLFGCFGGLLALCQDLYTSLCLTLYLQCCGTRWHMFAFGIKVALLGLRKDLRAMLHGIFTRTPTPALFTNL